MADCRIGSYVRDVSASDVAQNLATLNDFTILVAHWTDSYSSKLWKCFGCLTVRNRTEREIRRMFTIWSSMLERRTGAEKFRILAGLEASQPKEFRFHVFIGGVIARRNFEHTWSAKWLELGGTSADLHKYDVRSVWRYLETLSDKSGYDTIVKLPKARSQKD
jgi:hypothetical protein